MRTFEKTNSEAVSLRIAIHLDDELCTSARFGCIAAVLETSSCAGEFPRARENHTQTPFGRRFPEDPRVREFCLLVNSVIFSDGAAGNIQACALLILPINVSRVGRWDREYARAREQLSHVIFLRERVADRYSTVRAKGRRRGDAVASSRERCLPTPYLPADTMAGPAEKKATLQAAIVRRLPSPPAAAAASSSSFPSASRFPPATKSALIGGRLPP